MAAQEQQNCLIHSPGVEHSTLSSCSLAALSRIVRFRDQWVKYDCMQKFIAEKSYDFFCKKGRKGSQPSGNSENFDVSATMLPKIY